MEHLTQNSIKDNKIHVAILGSCILRDSIGYYHEGERFIVDRFVQDVSPVSAMDNSPLKKSLSNFLFQEDIKITEKEKTLSNFRKRNFVLDLEKSVFDYVVEMKSEWLLIDVACLHMALSYFNGCAVSNAPGHEEVFEKLIEHGYIDKPEKMVTADMLTDQYVNKRLDLFVGKILQYYTQNKIILFEIKTAKYCVQEDNTISAFLQEKSYDIIDKGYKYMLSKLGNCHIIEIPVNTLGDQKHKWGKYPLH